MIEPNKEMNVIIRENFKINNFNENEINIINYGLSNKEKQNVSYQKFESDMANTISNETLNYNFKKKSVESINTIIVDNIIKKYGIKDFQLVLDIEGEESNVLKKNNEWLLKCRRILLENHLPKTKLHDLNNYLIEKGFKIISKKQNVFLFMKV